MNDTECPVQIPGFTHNGDCNLLCKSTEWKDIVTFFLGNYGAHVATVVGRPGQSSLSWMFSLLLALCFPGAGVLTGLQAITSMALFAPTELTKAARAGALCIVVKVDQKPNGGERDLEASGQGVNGSLPSGQKAPSNASREDLFFPTASRSADEAIDLGPQPDVSQHRDEANDHQASAGALLQHHGGSIEINRPDTGQDRASRDDDRSQMTSQRSMAAHETALGEQPDEYFPPAFAATRVSGISRLPAGYRLLALPSWTTFESDGDEEVDREKQHVTPPPPATSVGRFRLRLAASFEPQRGAQGSIACSYNVIKVLISLGQLLFAAITIYETRGNQIDTFGYAAFGLTVAPYIWMSFINLLANLLCPQYAAMVVVNSPTLDILREELGRRGLEHKYPFHGTVGRISEDMERRVVEHSAVALRAPSAFHMFFEMLNNSARKPSERAVPVLRAYAAYGISAVPIAIVGGISRFRPGQSALYQRVWTMMWLCLGPMVGAGLGTVVLSLVESRPVLWMTILVNGEKSGKINKGGDRAGNSEEETRCPDAGQTDESSQEAREPLNTDIRMQLFVMGLSAAFLFAYMAPAIGGFVVVGQMLVQYGTCVKMN